MECFNKSPISLTIWFDYDIIPFILVLSGNKNKKTHSILNNSYLKLL